MGHHSARGSVGANGYGLLRWKVRVPSGIERRGTDVNPAIKDVDKALIAAGAKRSTVIELGGVLHECGPTSR